MMQVFSGHHIRKFFIDAKSLITQKHIKFSEPNTTFSEINENIAALCSHGMLKEALYLMNRSNMCLEEGETLVDARQVFDKMPQRSAVSWNSMIAGYVQNGKIEQAFELFRYMQGANVELNGFVFVSVLRGCISHGSIEQGRQVHGYVVKIGLELNVIVGSVLVDMYAKCDSIENACKVFDKMPEQDVVSWTTMIAGCAQADQGEKALKLYVKMQEQGLKGNQFTLTSVLTACAGRMSLEEGMQFHAYLIKSGFELSIFAANALVDMYAKCKRIEDAFHVFNKMPKRDHISWSTMVVGYGQNMLANEALELVCEMQWEGVKPDNFAFASILSACAGIAAIEQGMQVHTQIIQMGFEQDIYVENALVDMYSKCGNIEAAWNVFDSIYNPNVVSWTAMITGYAKHGLAEKAIQLFEQMLQVGIMPNHITFVGVLSACNHVGLVEKGYRYFESMIHDYGITPRMEHYVCMVDLYGRNGCLEEAKNLIDRMPIKPDALVWQTLLGSCKVHGNMELGKVAAEHVIELKPHDSAGYVLLSNIYATAGRWDEAANVWNTMKQRGVIKEPAHSWVVIKNKVHAFVAGDRSHPQAEEIYKTLEKLVAEMKEAGYEPNTESVLHDVEQVQKENSLYTHSERMAIAFGLMSTPEGTPIRIIKNLRVCGDCHEAAKFISKVVQREIVIRDTNRFHHFKDGLCSCRDYW
ncbi:pentatricopeptide repeat-containing protein At3g24000, mitochondrial [Cryptomeria japonica]|uniref:pentatricopeptide repeat-containing protein At3g24000, mitochondrial n=1 Tax=Cryptomeria japonica TaxID=3369 RepID=UPI0027D9DBD5|nr:pentatricopeptide repeat-containing protein At3g24000, mitochondrial [Cryptomeria japonica]